MRLATWSCHGALREEAARIAALRPDLLVVCECEAAAVDDDVDFGGATPSGKAWFGQRGPRARGLGMFSFGGIELRPEVPADDPLKWFVPATVTVPRQAGFQLVGVWTVELDDQARSHRQAHEGLVRHREWIGARDTVLLGDFGHDATHEGRGKTPWQELLALLRPLDLVSAYHEVHREAFGKESRPTSRALHPTASDHHLDLVFLPRTWLPRIRTVAIADLAEWRTHRAEATGRDHAPVVVDLAHTG